MTTEFEPPIASHKVEEMASFDERLEDHSESLVLECDCEVKLVLDSHQVAQLLWDDRLERSGFACSRCGKGYLITGVVSHRYSWMEGYLEQLEGREARDAYYSKL